jgi:hypothetical protein
MTVLDLSFKRSPKWKIPHHFAPRNDMDGKNINRWLIMRQKQASRKKSADRKNVCTLAYVFAFDKSRLFAFGRQMG